MKSNGQHLVFKCHVTFFDPKHITFVLFIKISMLNFSTKTIQINHFFKNSNTADSFVFVHYIPALCEVSGSSYFKAIQNLEGKRKIEARQYFVGALIQTKLTFKRRSETKKQMISFLKR